MSELLLPIVEIARLALRRHSEARARQPKRGATPYLRAALRAARQMASVSKTYPDLLPAALEIIDQVIRDAREAEAVLFAHGGNSSAYLTLLAAAEATRLTLLDKARRQLQAAPKTSVAPQPTPTPIAQPSRPTAAAHAQLQPLEPKTSATAKPTQHPHHYRKTPTAKLKAS